VGPAALPHLYGVIAAGLQKRQARGGGPLDLILCENLRHAAEIVRAGLRERLPEGFPLDEAVGLVETSIGKMVPLMTAEQRREDPLLVFAEAYNTLIVDRQGFRGGVPDVPGLDAKENMAAYVDRKLFIHNLGHAVAAYVGHLALPDAAYIWEAVGDERVRAAAAAAMWESGRALIAAYPDEFNEAHQREHIGDLLRRFGNRALGDTIYRVGRDVLRKLSPEDRLIGALRLQAQQGVASPYTVLGAAAACLFRAGDENGELFPADRRFAEEVYPRGLNTVLTEVCELDEQQPVERDLREQITAAHDFLTRYLCAGTDWLARYEGEHPIRSDP
jgi:mannitol-1-phosphate 5-dehydrogenase